MKLLKFTFTICIIFSISSCDATNEAVSAFNNSLEEQLDTNKDGIISDDEYQVLYDSLLIYSLNELGVDLGASTIDSVEYKQIPETTLVVIDSTFNTNDSINTIELYKSVTLEEYFPPIESQGNQGSCTGWASSSIASYYYNRKHNYVNSWEKKRLSPSFIYNRIALPNCEGAYTNKAAQFITEVGVVQIDLFPYNDEQCFEVDFTLDDLANENKLQSFKRINIETDQFKEWLKKGHPILVSIYVDKNFPNTNYMYTIEDVLPSSSAHAIAVVGFDDNLQAFKLYNSWGIDWGENGFIYVSYEAMLKITFEAYVFPYEDLQE